MLQLPPEIASAISSAGESVLATGLLAACGAWGGTWLDQALKTKPWLAILLSLTGICLGLTRMVLKAIEADQEESKHKK